MKALGHRTLGLAYAVAFADVLIAPYTPSNTARSAGMIYPVIRNRHEPMVLIEHWRQHYNAVRPHSSLGYRTPFKYKATLSLPGTTDSPSVALQ